MMWYHLILLLVFYASYSSPTAASSEDYLKLTGAARIGYSFLDYDDSSKDTYGDATFNALFLGLDASSKGVVLSAQYRFYPFMQTIHHLWIGYRWQPDLMMKVGISQVPFGMSRFASNGFWFNASYYVGIEDDYENGIKFEKKVGDQKWDFAFYKNPELSSDTNYDRYSFDVSVDAENRQFNSELNQFNVRWQSQQQTGSLSLKYGVSLQYGHLYNTETTQTGHHHAFAFHGELGWRNWAFQLQAASYQYQPENPVDVSDDFVTMSAFGAPVSVVAEAQVFNFNISRVFLFDAFSLKCYNDHSVVLPQVNSPASESRINSLGCRLQRGATYIYLDMISGKNMWFIGGPGMGLPNIDERYNSRLNLNIGYYF